MPPNNAVAEAKLKAHYFAEVGVDKYSTQITHMPDLRASDGTAVTHMEGLLADTTSDNYTGAHFSVSERQVSGKTYAVIGYTTKGSADTFNAGPPEGGFFGMVVEKPTDAAGMKAYSELMENVTGKPYQDEALGFSNGRTLHEEPVTINSDRERAMGKAVDNAQEEWKIRTNGKEPVRRPPIDASPEELSNTLQTLREDGHFANPQPHQAAAKTAVLDTETSRTATEDQSRAASSEGANQRTIKPSRGMEETSRTATPPPRTSREQATPPPRVPRNTATPPPRRGMGPHHLTGSDQDRGATDMKLPGDDDISLPKDTPQNRARAAEMHSEDLAKVAPPQPASPPVTAETATGQTPTAPAPDAPHASPVPAESPSHTATATAPETSHAPSIGKVERGVGVGMGGVNVALGTVQTIQSVKEGDVAGAALGTANTAVGATDLAVNAATAAGKAAPALETAGKIAGKAAIPLAVASVAYEAYNEQGTGEDDKTKYKAARIAVGTVGAGVAIVGTATTGMVIAPVVAAGTLIYAGGSAIEISKEYARQDKRMEKPSETLNNLMSMQSSLHDELKTRGATFDADGYLDYTSEKNREILKGAIADKKAQLQETMDENHSSWKWYGKSVENYNSAKSEYLGCAAAEKELGKYEESLQKYRAGDKETMGKIARLDMNGDKVVTAADLDRDHDGKLTSTDRELIVNTIKDTAVGNAFVTDLEKRGINFKDQALEKKVADLPADQRSKLDAQLAAAGINKQMLGKASDIGNAPSSHATAANKAPTQNKSAGLA